MSSYVFPFSAEGATLALVGGKGANLVDLVRVGFPVPARVYRHHGRIPYLPKG